MFATLQNGPVQEGTDYKQAAQHVAVLSKCAGSFQKCAGL